MGGGGGRGEDHTVSGGTRGDLSFPTKYKGGGGTIENRLVIGSQHKKRGLEINRIRKNTIMITERFTVKILLYSLPLLIKLSCTRP